MIAAVWQLLPVALGVMASPLAVLGLIGILLSRNARSNGGAYLVGWMTATALLLVTGILVFSAADAAEGYEVAGWVPAVHAFVGTVCILGAAWIYLRARRLVARIASAHTPAELASAAPRLPGLVRGVAGFTPGRSFLLGMAIFLNPMNVSLVAAAALAIAHSTGLLAERIWLALSFTIAAATPVAIPVLIVLIRRRRADPMLRALRRWMLKHNGYLSAGILAAVGVLQIVKALQIWL